MPNPKELTRLDVLRAAKRFVWRKKMPKWRVVVDDRELPARPLVLEAAGVPPNDPTNSHQAVAILENLGFETRYTGQNGERAKDEQAVQLSETPTDVKALLKTVERITSGIPKKAWKKIPTDLSINLDHYLYGHRKKDE
jgi:hypothetical protein